MYLVQASINTFKAIYIIFVVLLDSPAWLQVLGEFFDDLVPLLVPAKTGTRAVQVIFTSSEEDKDLLKVTSRILFLVIIDI